MTTEQAKRCGEVMKFEISNYVRKGIDLFLIGTFLGLVLTAAGCSTKTSEVIPPPEANNHILFVGDSFTHGRYLPVRTYNSANMTDENYGQSGARAETSAEPGPYGGIPGIFKEFTTEASLTYTVAIEAISATSLQNNYAAA